MQAEAAGLADARVEVGEVREHLLDLVADAVVVGDHARPSRPCVSGSVAIAKPATIAGSERRCSEAGFRPPREACTIDIESSTVTDCGPLACIVDLGAAEARQDEGLSRPAADASG